MKFYLLFRKAWVALGKFLEEFVYLAVKICHRDTLPSATPSFQVGKNFENREKHEGYNERAKEQEEAK